MNTSDWIILGAAILTGGGTLFLGIMAWRTIRQTRNLQKAEKRERLLNELIEWATDIKRCGWEVEYTIPSETRKEDIEMFQLQMSANRLSRFMIPNAKNKYVTEIAFILGENLCLAVKDTKKQLDNFLAQLQKTLSLSVKEIKKQSKNLEGYEKALYNSTDRVIEEAVKIKTRNLS